VTDPYDTDPNDPVVGRHTEWEAWGAGATPSSGTFAPPNPGDPNGPDPNAFIVTLDPNQGRQCTFRVTVLGKEFFRIEVYIIRADIDVDSNNDGAITEADEAIEDKLLDPNYPGVLIPDNDPEPNDPNNLVEVKLSIKGGPSGGKWYVTQSNPFGGSIALYFDRSKQQPVDMNSSHWGDPNYGYARSQLPEKLYAEGVQVSGVLTTPVVYLGYDPDEDGQKLFQDSATTTVFKLDLDVDSDNNNRYGSPQRNKGEDDVEANAPGKVILINLDDDNADGIPDCNDGVVNGAADWNDMASMVAEFKVARWDPNIIRLFLDSSDYSCLRVMDPNGNALFGPGQVAAREIDPNWMMPSGLWNLKVEGVSIGSATISLVLRTGAGREVYRDSVRFTVTDTLETAPLNFQHRSQHKDTQMLCVAGNAVPGDPRCPQTGAHRWDADHGAYFSGCPHCRDYCTRASIQMVNRYYDTDPNVDPNTRLTQDRISYHSRGSFGDPNNDLGHGIGLWPLGVTANAPLAWALGLGSGDFTELVNNPPRRGHDDDWQLIADGIITYRPVFLVRAWDGDPNFLHSSVFCGVRYNAGVREVRLADPAGTTTWEPFTVAGNIWVERLIVVRDERVESIVARHDEADVRSHSDGDEVVDFDEDNRFERFETAQGYQLDKTRADSGGGPDNDKVELRTFYTVP